MHPVVLASAILSLAITASAFGPRFLPEPAPAAAAPPAQWCRQTVDSYRPGVSELVKHGDPMTAFVEDVVKPTLAQGQTFATIEFEVVSSDDKEMLFLYAAADCG